MAWKFEAVLIEANAEGGCKLFFDTFCKARVQETIRGPQSAHATDSNVLVQSLIIKKSNYKLLCTIKPWYNEHKQVRQTLFVH